MAKVLSVKFLGRKRTFEAWLGSWRVLARMLGRDNLADLLRGYGA